MSSETQETPKEIRQRRLFIYHSAIKNRVGLVIDAIYANEKQAEAIKNICDIEVFRKFQTNVVDTYECLLEQHGKKRAIEFVYDAFSGLEGRMLTLVDAFVDKDYAKATKDVVSRVVWLDCDELIKELNEIN